MRESAIPVSEIGLGCAGIGNLGTSIDDDVAHAVVDAAWASGIRYFDTAPHYGLGLAERRLGAALARHPRDSFVISTKVGRILEPNAGWDGRERDSEGFDVPASAVRRWDFSRAGVLHSLDSSLERIGCERIDIAFIHDPDDSPAGHERALNEAAPTLESLRDEGVIAAFGVGTRNVSTLKKFVEQTSVDVIMIAGRYTLLNHDRLDGLLETCADHDVSVVNVGVFNSGILARPRPIGDARYEYQAASPEIISRVNAIADVCEQFGTLLPRAALAFARDDRAVTSIVLGAQSPDQVRENIALLEQPDPPHEFWAELARRGLMATGSREATRSS